MDRLVQQRQFQQRYRQGIGLHYHGYGHGICVLAIGLGIIGYCVWKLELTSWQPLLTVIAALIIANGLEYLAHRQLGHKRTRILPLFYERHSGDHHRFFTHLDPLWRDHRDWRVVLFPLYLIVAVASANGAVAWGVALLFGPAVGYLWLMTTVAAYLWYEVAHFCWHLPEQSWVFRIGFLRRMRLRHLIHHHPLMMNRVNFNITWPLFDYLLGTDSLNSQMMNTKG